MTIRYGIRWDGRGRPKPARMAALGLASLALLLPASARADDTAPRRCSAIAGGSGIDGLARPTAQASTSRSIDSGVVPVGSLAEPGRVVYGPDFSSERRDRRLATLDTFGHGTHLAGLIAGRDPITGFAGVAPGARLVSLKVAGADGETSLAQRALARSSGSAATATPRATTSASSTSRSASRTAAATGTTCWPGPSSSCGARASSSWPPPATTAPTPARSTSRPPTRS